MPPKLLLATFALFTAALLPGLSADPLVPRLASEPGMKPEDTEIWKPIPTVVNSPAGGIPSDAIVLFDGRSPRCLGVGQERSTPSWKLEAGAMVVVPGSGDLRTKASFGDIQLHIEFCEPAVVVGDSQGRGNSGVLFMGLYELQVLDSHDNPTYVNGQAGGRVQGNIPWLVNASRRPGEWQTYDAVWIAPRFASDGSLKSPAHLTVFHNGVLVQHDVTVLGQTRNVGHPKYVPHPAKLPLVLQDHHHPVAFRNIWVRELSLPEAK